jgi:molecular chaperone HtpG
MNPAMFESGITLTLNANNDLVKYVLNHKDGENTEMICKQLYDLALISHKQLSADEMTNFIKRSNDIMLLLTKES